MNGDILDEALDRLSSTGPEWQGGLSNHGPMAVEALVRLGRADQVESWLDGYLPQLDPERPRPRFKITEADWREALGDYRRVGDWLAYFTDQLAQAPWRDVLVRWWPRLLPGVVAGATHGVIRASQAIRMLAEDPENPHRQAELAAGLAYWAARYVELPATVARGNRSTAQALAAMPSIAVPKEGLIVSKLAPVAASAQFVEAVASLEPRMAVDAAFGSLTRTFAEVYVHLGRNNPISLVHAVTAPAAVRSILPHLPEPLWRPSHDALWQVGAALYTAFAHGKPRDAEPVGPAQDPQLTVEAAVASGDEHAIKLAEACLREYRINADPIYLHAAARGIYAAA
jgi:hypothetical protein